MSLAFVIKTARTSLGINQEFVASEMAVTVQTYSKWENGLTEPKASQVPKLAQLLNVSSSEICKGQFSKTYTHLAFLEQQSIYRRYLTDFDIDKCSYQNINNHQEYFDALENLLFKEDIKQAVTHEK